MMRPITACLALLAAGTALSSCAIPDEYLAKLPGPPPEKEARAERVEYAHDVAFHPLSARLEPDERRLLDDFLGSTRAGATDRFMLTAANGIDHSIANQRGEMVEAYLRSRGVREVLHAPDAASGEDGAPPRDSVRVTVERHVVVLPPCPDWSKFPGTSFANTVHSNFGCATAVNLGLMVADPADLASGRDMGPQDGEYGAVAIQRYRAGETKPIHGQLSAGNSDNKAPSINLQVGGAN